MLSVLNYFISHYAATQVFKTLFYSTKSVMIFWNLVFIDRLHVWLISDIF